MTDSRMMNVGSAEVVSGVEALKKSIDVWVTKAELQEIPGASYHDRSGLQGKNIGSIR